MNQEIRSEDKGACPKRRPLVPLADVLYLDRMIGGDPVTEGMILKYIGKRWGALNLARLPASAAAAIRERPVEFVQAVKRYYAPELNL